MQSQRIRFFFLLLRIFIITFIVILFRECLYSINHSTNRKKLDLLTLGDSIILGSNASNGSNEAISFYKNRNYPGSIGRILCDLKNCSEINQAFPGETRTQIKNRFLYPLHKLQLIWMMFWHRWKSKLRHMRHNPMHNQK